jgi:hypothetical protein
MLPQPRLETLPRSPLVGLRARMPVAADGSQELWPRFVRP